jgi:acyl-coenzyme A thioesterase PaaI-like protein
MERAPSRISAEAFLALIHATIPSSRTIDLQFDALQFGFVRLRQRFDPAHVRAGGTISGPTLMGLADTALYAMVLSLVGLEPLAVTTDLSFHFLSKPGPVDLIAEARVLKHGRRLVVGDTLLYSDGKAEPVVHATGTYALPSAPLATAT